MESSWYGIVVWYFKVCCFGYRPLSISTTSGVFIAIGVSVVSMSIVVRQLSLSAASWVHLFLVVVISLLFLSDCSKYVLLLTFRKVMYNLLLRLQLICYGYNIIDSNIKGVFHSTSLLCKKRYIIYIISCYMKSCICLQQSVTDDFNFVLSRFVSFQPDIFVKRVVVLGINCAFMASIKFIRLLMLQEWV